MSDTAGLAAFKAQMRERVWVAVEERIKESVDSTATRILNEAVEAVAKEAKDRLHGKQE